MRLLEADHVSAKLRPLEPERDPATHPATVARKRVDARSALASDHQHEARAVVLRVAQKAHQRVMRLRLREAMQVDARIDRLRAARELLPGLAIERNRCGHRTCCRHWLDHLRDR